MWQPSRHRGTVKYMSSRHNHLNIIRVTAAIVGIVAIAVAELLTEGKLQSDLADIGLVGLVTASVMLSFGNKSSQIPDTVPVDLPRTVQWRWTTLGLGLFTALVTQTWFRAGTVIAVGDNTPPIGTAWIGKLFVSIGWSGNNLGAPINNEIQLPFAVVDWLTHQLGGSGALAQRLFLTLLATAIVVAASTLARSLGLSPTAGVIVGITYYFSPMTMSQVNINGVYLVAMVLIPTLASAVISYGRNHLRIWQLCLIFVVSAPFVGYAYNNPPLVAMLALTTVTTPLLVWAGYDRIVALRSLKGLLCAGSLLIAVSSYWLVPSWIAIQSIAAGNLSEISAWVFTESRATLANGLWLNNTWAWAYSQYYPYATEFARFPLNLVPVLVPTVAFSGLALRRCTSNIGLRSSRVRGVIAFSALFVVLISTGTRTPGNVLFDPLYHLPYGWLLREPGRFLMVAALAYALLIGLLVEEIQRHVQSKVADSAAVVSWRPSLSWLSTLVSILAIAVALSAGFPLWTGAVAPGARQGFPSVHVKVPHYWEAAFRFLNSTKSPPGSLLVLPPDDFYQMPYTWFYGNDGFIVNALKRDVVVPSGQGYDTVSTELLSAVKLEATSLLGHNWSEGGHLLTAIGTPIVLVRGDINSQFQGRSIVQAAALIKDLKNDPEMKLIYHVGELSLFELKAGYYQAATSFATVNSKEPNLNDLALVNRHTVLVTSTPRSGYISLIQLPSIVTWQVSDGFATIQVQVRQGWNYSLRAANSVLPVGAERTVSSRSTSGNVAIRVKVPIGKSIISDGTFASGKWGPIENCYNVTPVRAPQYLRATVVPRATPDGSTAIELTATIDSACESTPLSWSRGPIEFGLWERSVSGPSPRLCLWEEPIGRCASVPPLPSGSGWHRYETLVHPDSGTTSISVFLYADSAGNGQRAIEEYAKVTALSLPATPTFVLFGTPKKHGKPEGILTTQTGYSPQWIGPAGSTHVLVDGLRNAWIGSHVISVSASPSYAATSHKVRDEIGISALILVTDGALMLWWLRRMKYRKRKAE